MSTLKAILTKSINPKYKYTVIVNGKKINFGAAGYSDYTKHHDPMRKKQYIARHEAREDWTNPYTAGFWSRWLLWNLPTLQQSINDINFRFDIDFIH